MSDDTFTLITQKQMGVMSPKHAKALDRIDERRAELELELASLDEQQEAIILKTVQRLKIDTDGPFRGIRVAEDRTVHAQYCACPNCQAQLNNTTVTEATRIMLERGFVHPENAREMLQRAAAVDKQRGPPIIH